MMLANCRLFLMSYCIVIRTAARIRMGLAEVAGMEGLGRVVMGLTRLWKCVEKSKHHPVMNQTSKECGTQEPRSALGLLQPPVFEVKRKSG
jgi:hypothetical protein